jgi:NAD-dependent protein deacetylases, SIR2 family
MKKETYDLYKNVKPNIGHEFVVTLYKNKQLLGLITQNVDGLHELAGLPRNVMIELHGTDRYVGCLSCSFKAPASRFFENIQKKLPHCPDCNGLLKSATISFGQSLNQQDLQKAHEWSSSCDCFIVLGSSLVVHPAASLPEIAVQNNIPLIIINNTPTPLDPIATLSINQPIGKVIQKLNKKTDEF